MQHLSTHLRHSASLIGMHFSRRSSEEKLCERARLIARHKINTSSLELIEDGVAEITHLAVAAKIAGEIVPNFFRTIDEEILEPLLPLIRENHFSPQWTKTIDGLKLLFLLVDDALKNTPGRLGANPQSSYFTERVYPQSEPLYISLNVPKLSLNGWTARTSTTQHLNPIRLQEDTCESDIIIFHEPIAFLHDHEGIQYKCRIAMNIPYSVAYYMGQNQQDRRNGISPLALELALNILNHVVKPYSDSLPAQTWYETYQSEADSNISSYTAYVLHQELAKEIDTVGTEGFRLSKEKLQRWIDARKLKIDEALNAAESIQAASDI